MQKTKLKRAKKITKGKSLYLEMKKIHLNVPIKDAVALLKKWR